MRFLLPPIPVALVLTALLTACQPLPQPFARNGAANPLLSPRAQAGILVRPARGVPRAHALAEAIAKALQREDIPADTRNANPVGYVLTGRAEAVPGPLGGKRRLIWYLADRKGRVKGTHSQTMAPLAFTIMSFELRASLAADAAHKFASMLGTEGTPGPTGTPTIAVPAVTGAPGDGRLSLTRAMAFELEKAGYRTIPEPAAGALVVRGKVSVGPAKANQQTVEITWTLVSAKGREIGTVAQKNRIPAGSLEDQWGTTAALVAQAGAPGLNALIKRRTGARPVPRKSASGPR